MPRTRRRKVIEAAAMEDKISNLPDSILCHILSFIPTEDGVRTSILSSRWRYLFASVPNLDFDDEYFTRLDCQHSNSAPRDMTKFVNFVDKVLSLRNISYTHKFRLSCWDGINISRVNVWISDALCRNVRELYLSIPSINSIPSQLFTCQSLVVLKLTVLEGMSPRKASAPPPPIQIQVCLPNLKILDIDGVDFGKDADSFRRLVSGCSMLENLVMGCHCENALTISNPTLQSMTLVDQYDFDYGGFVGIVIDTPKLIYLDYHVHSLKYHSFKNIQSLVKADIFVGQLYDEDEGDFLELLTAISHVMFLKLSGFTVFIEMDNDSSTMQVIRNCCHMLPMFSYLSHLVLDGLFLYLPWLLPLLENSPVLETLVLMGPLDLDEICDYEHQYRIPEENHWDPPQKVPSCLLFHLNTIEINWFLNFRKEFELDVVKFLLKNARMLSKMTIRLGGSLSDKFEFSKKLLMFPRGSVSCQIAIS